MLLSSLIILKQVGSYINNKLKVAEILKEAYLKIIGITTNFSFLISKNFGFLLFRL